MRQRRRAVVVDRVACAERLAAGLNGLALSIAEGEQARLLDYVEVLAAWNATHNLTAVRAPEAMVVRHLLDCLAIRPFIDGPRVADVGTGPGLPGLVLATVCADTSFTLVESNHKKVAFLRHARRTLGLENVDIRAARVEDVVPETVFDWVVTRAFASAAQTVHHAGQLIGADTRLGLMKARDFAAEAADLPPGFVQQADHRLQVPGLDGARRFVVIGRDTSGRNAQGLS